MTHIPPTPPTGGYFVNDIVVMHLLRAGENEMWVEYRVFSQSAANWTEGFTVANERTDLYNHFKINYGTLGPEDDYRYLMHDHGYWISHMNLIDPVITPPAVFNPNRIASVERELITNDPTHNRDFGGPLHLINDPALVPPLPPVSMGAQQQPFFRIQRGGGFSFSLQPGLAVDQSAAHSVHFVWDDEFDLTGNTFIMTTGGLMPGAFYEFRLNRSFPIDWMDPALPALVWPTPPHVPPASPTNPFTLINIPATPIAVQRAFTGFMTSTVPLAQHREVETTVQPWHIGRTGHFDYLWRHPEAPWGPPDYTDRKYILTRGDNVAAGLAGYTNWDLPGFPRPNDPTFMDPLWHPWNQLDHTHPVHAGINDFLPGFAGTRAINARPELEPLGGFPSNMLRVRVEIPLRFVSEADPAAPGGVHQAWERMDASEFAAMSFNFNIDLQIPPNIRTSFAYQNIFGGYGGASPPSRADNGAPPFIPLADTAWRTAMDGTEHIGTDFYIMGLEPSRLFPHFHLEILPPSMAILRPGMADVVAGDNQGGGSRFPVDNVHTFLEYDVVFIGGRFHVRIFPFVDAHGDYIVLTNTLITAPHRSNGRDVLFIPLYPGGPPSHVQVRFMPSLPAMDDLYSQVMVFTPVSDRHIFTEPANFVLHPDNPPLTFYDPNNENEAIFSVDVGWDLATVQQLLEYFQEVAPGRGPGNTFGPDAPGWVQPPSWQLPLGARPASPGNLAHQEWFLPEDELIFTYLLHSRLNPWDEEGQPFAFVDVIITLERDGLGNPTHFEWEFDIREFIDPPVFQVLADPPPTMAVPLPGFVYVTKTAPFTHSALVLDQFGLPYTASTPVITWQISNISGGTATIDQNTGVVTASGPSVEYTVTATAEFAAYGINRTRSLVVTNPAALTAPTGISITSPPDTVFQNQTETFAAAVAPAPALQNVRWEVTSAASPGQTVPGATITQGGVLFVTRDVEAGTQLVITARTNSLGSAVFSASHTVTVAVPERSQTISGITMDDTIRIGVGPGGVPGGDIRLSMIASRVGVTVPPLPHFFNFPEIYHITAQLFDINANDNRAVPIRPPLPESNHQPMTLDAPAEPQFPPPQNLRAWVDEDDEDDPYIIGGYFDMAFDVPLSRIRHYIDSAPRRGADVDVTLRVFISESQDAIHAITGMAGDQRIGTGTNAATLIPVTASANGVPQILAPFSDSGNLEALRAGPVAFEVDLSAAMLFSDEMTLSQVFKLHGLDRNRQYFITMDAVALWHTVPEYLNPSTTTNIAGITTMGDLAPPDPDGMRPSMPQDLRVDDITVSSADLSWLPVAPLTSEGGQIRYQVLRMRADQLPDELLDRHDFNMTRVLAEINELGLSNPEALLITQGTGPGYNEVRSYITGVAGPIGDIAPGFLLRHGTLDPDDPNDTEERVIFRDTNLSPNTLYFYYVRTVWHTPGGMTYSAWVGVSVTTSLVDPPENLRREFAPWIGGAVWQDFDPRFQFVIRFDAPVGTLDAHGTLYDFQYSLREGDAPWEDPARLTGAMLLERIPTPGREGFYQFTYLISGLLPGTQYSIRVRTMDLINGDYSMYSNIATTRTDTDQDTIDRERDLANLHQYLRDLIAEFIRQHHWTAQNSLNVFSAVYRPSMVNNLVETNGSMIRLAMTGQNINIYYLPQALFLRTWQAERGFIIARDDMEIAIPSHAFNMIDNEAILQAQQRIRDVPGVMDYYVRITVAFSEHGENVQIHGRQPAGQEIVFSFEVVETSTTAAQLDEDILAVLQHRLNIDYYTQPFVDEINQMLDREESYEDMVRRLHQIAENIQNQMAAYVNSQLLPTLDRVYEVNYVSQPVTVRLINQPTSAVVNGFRFAGANWVQQEVNIQGGARAMRTSGTGAFAFNIQNLNLPGVSQMQGNETLTALFVRYGLHDFLGTDAAFNLQNNITLQQVQGVAARLAGAPAAANPQTWLRGQGYIVPVRGANSPATTQEALYILMAVYEIRTNTNIAGLRISNFNAAGNISGIDARFRPSIQAAFELNLYTNADMNPTAPISVEDVLRMILAINQRVPL
ncbi:MAG: hypothetical protein LBE55_04865 [Clostridiales bacterium]|nr:hypothetical protein [Clostridiales bacterium]